MGPRYALTRRLRALALGFGAVTTAVLVTLTSAAPALADPSVAEIEKQISDKWNALEPTIEQFNKVNASLTANRAKQAELEKALKPLQLQTDLALAKVGATAARAYKSGSASTLTILFSSESPENLLEQLSLINHMSRRQLAEISNVTTTRDKYLGEKKTLDDLVGQLAKQASDLGTKKKEIEAEVASLQKLRQQVYGSGGTGPLRPAACPFETLGGAGTEAAKKACAQIGKPYVYGASGPDSFDCSGLTMYAWSGSVSLPHNAAEQSSRSTSVARGSLIPGDLVFYYSPIHHVAIYVGGDWVVHAPSSGDQVRMAKVDGTAKAVGFGRPK